MPRIFFSWRQRAWGGGGGQLHGPLLLIQYFLYGITIKSKNMKIWYIALPPWRKLFRCIQREYYTSFIYIFNSVGPTECYNPNSVADQPYRWEPWWWWWGWDRTPCTRSPRNRRWDSPRTVTGTPSYPPAQQTDQLFLKGTVGWDF